jgi:phosphoglycerate dehydrogenase-like enzyme
VNVSAVTQSDGDGAGGAPAALRAMRGAEVYVGFGLSPKIAQAGMGTLRWAHSAAAGVGSSLTPELAATGARFTNSRAVHAEPMADWVLAAMGYWFRGLHAMVAAQRAGRWSAPDFTDRTVVLRELADVRVGLVGLGGIGSAVARRCGALGMKVSAVRRRTGRPRPAGIDWAGGPGQIRALARRSNALVISAPLTQESRQMVNDAVLRALPRGAVVINVSRGAVMDEAALLRHLDSGRIAGAALDVFRHEPLARNHPFWKHPRVLVSPHVSAVSERFWERETELIVDNVRRYKSGRPLRNLVDRQAGY